MQTRRQLLAQALALPFVAGLGVRPAAGAEILAEPNWLSEESAEGFRSLRAAEDSSVIVLCGVSAIDDSRALRLREQAAAGRWVIWEISPVTCRTQARVLREVFDIGIGEPLVLAPYRLASTGMYLRYRWPRAALTRSFSAVVPVACSNREGIALYGNTVVAMRRPIGRGGLVLLGSMLGPNLRAEEREAHTIGEKMLSALA